MSNLLPPASQKRMKNEVRARLLLSASAALLCCGVLFSLALLPAESATIFFPSVPAQNSEQPQGSADDSSAISHTNALLAAVQTVSTSTSLLAISEALADRGSGITIDDIAYTVGSESLTLGGHAETPDEVNTFRETLQKDADFSDVSVPVSALLGSEGGGFTITMKVAH